jgi:tetratricopeptide (TPR) repeat protein
LTGIRYDGWKLIKAPTPELYDLRNDPRETNNLYDVDRTQANRMQGIMDQSIALWKGPLENIGPTRELDDSATDKLMALGYIMPHKSQPTGPLPDPKDMIRRLNSRFDSKERLRAAQALLSRGDLDGAERELRRALELDPENAIAVHDLGLVFWRRGQTDEALPLLEQAARLDSTKVEPHSSLAAAYMTLDRFNDAASELETAVKLAPENTETRLMYANALERTGDFEEALRQYQRCLVLAPDQVVAYYRAAVLHLRSGRKAEARKLLEEMLEREPSGRFAQEARTLLREAAGEQ